MKLSVILVNYNVCHFLDQALGSVRNAMAHITGEIIVVDNNSVDGSVEMLTTKYPEVILIRNKKNVGFSKANNQGIKIAKGEYVLLLNPDTLVEEDTFLKCISFMDARSEAGGLGVKMLDGKGVFLPESKRGLPSPAVAFYKIFGLAALFPASRKFGRYHLGFLDKEQTHEVEILSGAFMFMRKSVLDQIGYLDEDYFMYGEDIDLSYRILKAGYRNYYYPETRIIHYKGESTKKTSINYVFIFYRAMIIFAEKHFSSKNAWLFSFLINIAIYIRAAMAIGYRAVKQLVLPLTDAALIYGGMYLLKNWWEADMKVTEGVYPPVFMNLVVPLYILVWQLSVYYNGGYEKNGTVGSLFKGLVAGTFFISAISNFFDPYRFSKALILLGGGLAFGVMFSLRLLIHYTRYRNLSLGSDKRKRILIVGGNDESMRVMEILNESNYSNLQIVGFITPYTQKRSKSNLNIGSTDQLDDIISFYRIDELIFCSKDIGANSIIEWMSKLDHRVLEFKIVPDAGNYIIGSNSKNKPGEFYTVNIELSILKKDNIRNKRIFDCVASLVLFVLSPLLIFFIKNKSAFYRNIFKVLGGSYSWVGFSNNDEFSLPRIKKGIINPVTYLKESKLDTQTVYKLNFKYAKEYTLLTDLHLLLRSIRNLG